MPEWLYIILVNIVIGYTALCAIFYFLQDYFFFRPEILPKQFEYRYPFPFSEVNFEMEDGSQINGIHFKVPNAKGVVYYLKGNSRSIKGWGKFARDFVSKGYDFFMFDYRGFGKSSGRRTEQNLYNDAQAVYKWLSTLYPEDQIVIYGRSMGSGIAARIASWNKPKMLILDAPYFSFLYQVRRYGFWLPLKWLLRYQLRSDQFIKKVTCPIYIIHGNKDRLISYKQGKMLAALVPDRATLVTIDGAYHNNLPEFPAYHEHLYDILHDIYAPAQLQQVA
ncbi:MAG: alpha/beta fold hydrolase [Saprospiraceae bacterium]|nr:alpha/beta fold hydrolase [Saprospiraceae bacterium]